MLRVIGAGFGRTGTASLKLALETLLGGPCYHMFEAIQRPADFGVWHQAVTGEPVDWESLLAGWSAIVDFPGAAVVDDLADAFPDAKVLLSTRDPESWWASADRTILRVTRDRAPDDPSGPFVDAMLERSGIDVHDRDASIRAFVEHNERVRATYDSDRLIEWEPGDGWAPLCAGLGIEEPPTPYPHTNTSGSFEEEVARVRAGDVRRNAAPPPSG